MHSGGRGSSWLDGGRRAGGGLGGLSVGLGRLLGRLGVVEMYQPSVAPVGGVASQGGGVSSSSESSDRSSVRSEMVVRSHSWRGESFRTGEFANWSIAYSR